MMEALCSVWLQWDPSASFAKLYASVMKVPDVPLPAQPIGSQHQSFHVKCNKYVGAVSSLATIKSVVQIPSMIIPSTLAVFTDVIFTGRIGQCILCAEVLSMMVTSLPVSIKAHTGRPSI